MKLEMVKITPPVAAKMLENNTLENRHIKHGHLQKLVSDMNNGYWDQNNGETIKVNDKGELVDGQHRLHAIIDSGKTFTLPILSGVSSDAFSTLDSGSSRTLADIFTGKGYKGANVLAGAVGCLFQFYEGDFHKKQNSHRAMLKIFEMHNDITEYTHYSNTLRLVFRPSEGVFLTYCLGSIAPKKGIAFMEALAKGGSPKGSVEHQLREKLLNYRIRKSTGFVVVSRLHIIGSVFKAWNMVCRGKGFDEFKMLQLGEDVLWPVGFIKAFPEIQTEGIAR